MRAAPSQNANPPAKTLSFYRRALRILVESGVPFLVGGGYAFSRYTGIVRHTKDLDVFVEPERCPDVLAELTAAGYRTEITFSHWIGKAFSPHGLIDVIFNSGNGLCPVDEGWFAHSTRGRLFGVPVRFCPAEEMIWQKAFIMERDRFDGADVLHLMRSRRTRLDWSRLFERMGRHWPVLLVHLILLGYAFPGEKHEFAQKPLEELLGRLSHSNGVLQERLCQGTFLSLLEYLPDVRQGKYRDARLPPSGTMTERQIADWTKAFLK